MVGRRKPGVAVERWKKGLCFIIRDLEKKKTRLESFSDWSFGLAQFYTAKTVALSICPNISPFF